MKLYIGLLLAFACLALGVLGTIGPAHAGVAASPPTAAPARNSAPGAPATSCFTGTWGMAARYPIPIEAQAVVAYGGQIYSFGGDDGLDAVARAYKFDPGTNGWIRLADLPNPLHNLRAVTDGTSIYLVGGYSAGVSSTSLLRYNPGTNTYTPLSSYVHPTDNHAAAYLNGKIYRVGGDDNGGGTSSVEVYSISQNTWAAAAPIPYGADGLAVVAVGDYLYAAGGYLPGGSSTKTFRYDPATDTWDDAAIADLPVGHAVAASDLLDGRWLLAGGIDGHHNDRIDAWDPATNTWTGLSPLPTGHYGLAGATVGSTFYTIGGDFDINLASTDNQQYRETVCTSPTPTVTGTPPTATYTATPTRTATPATTPCRTGTWVARAPNPAALGDSAYVALGGFIYQFGGLPQYHGPQGSPNAYRYDPAHDQWTALAPLPQPVEGPRAVSDGTAIYILGGIGGDNENGLLWRYDPAQNTYTTLAPYYIGTAHHAAVYLNGKIYRISGCETRYFRSCPTPTVEVYTISTDTWTSATPYPAPAWGLMATAIGNYIYAAGGEAGSGVTSKTYRYDPTTDSWDDAAIADLPDPQALSASGLLNGRWLIAGVVANFDSVAWDPGLNNWAALPALPSIYDPVVGGAVLGNALYVMDSHQTLAYVETLCSSPGATATPTRTALPGTTATATPCAVSFSDVQPTDYFYTPVQYLACRGVVSGYSGGTFRPYANTTRAQQVKLVALGFALPIQTPTGGAYTFADVPPGAPFHDVVETAFAAGIASGYGCGGPGEACDAQHRRYFRPNAPVTRGQLAKLDVLAAGWTVQTPASATFTDVPAGSAFYGVVETAVCHGVISGYSDHTFRPGAPATRGQIAKIVYLSLLAPPACSGP